MSLIQNCQMSLVFKLMLYLYANLLREICLIKHTFMICCCKNMLFTACFGNVYKACVMGKLSNFKLISKILLCNNSFRINNLPKGWSVRHTFAIGNVYLGKGARGRAGTRDNDNGSTWFCLCLYCIPGENMYS